MLMMLVLCWYTITRAPKVTHGFVVYYTNARMLLEGEDFQRAYDYEYFNGKIEEYGIRGIKDVPHNLPTNALLLLPLAWMTPEQTKIVLSAVSFVAILVSLIILLQTYGVRIQDNLGLGLSILLLAWRPIYDNIYLGQVYAVLLLLFCLSMAGIRNADSSISPIPIALAFLFKGHGVVPMAWLAVQNRWKTLSLVLMWVLVVALGILPLVGIDAWFAFYSRIVSTLGTNPTDAGTSYQTINSLIYHLFTYDPQWLPNPLVILRGYFVKLISYATNLALIVYILMSGRRSPQSTSVLSFSAAVAAGVVTAPLAEEYAFTLFLPLVFGLVVSISGKFQRTHRLGALEWICLSAIVVLAIPIHYKDFQYVTFPLVLLAYPKLFAGIATLLCFGRMAKSGYFDQTASEA